MYVLFAFLSLIPYLGLTVTNKFCTNKRNAYVVATIKGLFFIVCCFVLVCCLGHVTTMGEVFKSPEATVYLVLTCLETGIGWVLYFFAFTRSTLGLFNSTCLITKIFSVNLINIIVDVNLVTNGFKPLNITLYMISTVVLFGMLVATWFNKEAKEKGSRIWILMIFLDNLLGAIVVVFMINKKLPTSVIYEDVLLFYEAIMIALVNFVVVCFQKNVPEFKKVSLKENLFILLSAVFEIGFYYLYYRSINSEGSIPAISNIIANAGLFLLVEMWEIFVSKKKPNLFHGVLLILFVVCMILTILAGCV